VLDLLNLLKNPTIVYLTAGKVDQINHVNQYKCFYRLSINISICAMGLTNSFVAEYISKFPYGWLFGGLSTLIMLNSCFCFKKMKLSIFRTSDDSIKIYDSVYCNTGFIHGTFIWAIIFFLGLAYIMMDVYRNMYV